MGWRMPCLDERVDLCPEMVCGCNIRHTPACAVPDTTPLVAWLPPRTLHRGEVHPKPRRRGHPSGDLGPWMGPAMGPHARHRPQGVRKLPVHVCQTGTACRLPLALSARPLDLTGAGLKGGPEVPCPSTRGCRLKAVGPGMGLGWQGRGWARVRWPRGWLLPGEVDHPSIIVLCGARFQTKGTHFQINLPLLQSEHLTLNSPPESRCDPVVCLIVLSQVFCDLFIADGVCSP
jgi:hypothetical protein